MSVGTKAVTLTVDAAAKRMYQSAAPSFRNLVTFTITNAGIAAANLALLAYRGATVVATATGFTGTTASAVGTMDLNTAGMLTVMNLVTKGAVRSFDILLYDTVTLDMVARGVLDVLGADPYSAVDPGASTPIAAAGVYFENIDGINYFVLKDAAGVVYAKFPAPGATPND